MKKLLGSLLFLLLLAGAAAAYAWYDYRQSMTAQIAVAEGGSSNGNTGAQVGNRTFVVERGWSAKRTANERRSKGLSKSRIGFTCMPVCSRS